MAAATWLRVFDIVGGLARRTPPAGEGPAGMAPAEVHLLSFAVGAIKKAFDRDSDRMALERQHLEAERARAEAALRLEWLRQETERRLGEAKLISALALGVWIVSAGLGVVLAEGYALGAKALLGFSWTALIASLATAMLGYRAVAMWVTVAATAPADPPDRKPMALAMWLLIAGFALSSASVLVAL